MKSTLRLLAVLGVAVCALLPARAADVDDVIARARAGVGSEDALAALRSVHFTGMLETSGRDAEGREKTVRVAIEIIFQHPDRQRIVATSEDKIEITALDGYEAWQREQDPADPTRWRMTLLPPEQVKRLRANTWENLSFYRGIERRGGTVKDLGPVTQDGKACVKLAFIHDDAIVFYRYFDAASGRLVLTETESGLQIREEGELVAGGLRFPKKITTSTPDAADTRAIVITFDKVSLNEPFADSLFAVPAMSR